MSLLQMSLAGAGMILVIIVIRALAINRVPKLTFLVLWGAALLRLLVPVSVPSGLSIYSLLAPKAAPVMTADAPAAVIPARPTLPTGQMAAQVESGAASGWTVSVWGAVWAVGLVVCAVMFTAAYWNCYREFQISFPVEHDAAARWLQTHPLRRRISIRQSDRVSSPLTFGVWHPVILMPKKTDWDDKTVLQYVLEHEFVHIRRFDTCSKLLLIAAVCVHWFNPLVWVMYVLANRDIELSCDEAVVRRFGSGARASYAKALIRMEETKSGFAPLCNHFSKNAIEERITAIMKTKKITVISLLLAVVLVAGTVTVFATSAKAEANNSQETTAVSGTDTKADEELLAAGLTYQGCTWFYQDKAVAGMYDDNGGIYTNDVGESGIYLAVKRGSDNKITEFVQITRKQFTELVDRHMNDVETEVAEASLMSYVNPDDGKTYYSFDDGKTFEPLTDEEFEARFPTPDVEWWTYDEYKAWLDNEKVQLQSMISETGWVSGREFVWTQEEVNRTIAMYEGILADIRNGILYSKSVDGQEDLIMSYNPADVEMGTSAAEEELYIEPDNGKGDEIVSRYG